MKTVKKVLAAIAKFFRWPYANQAVIVGFGLVEYLGQFHWFGGITMILGIWAFLITFNEPKK